MKIRIIIIIVSLLVVCSLLTLVLILNGGSASEGFSPDEWNELSEVKLDEKVVSVFESGYLPEGEEVRFISWLLADHTDKGIEWIREYADRVRGMEWHLSNTAYQLIKQNNNEMGSAVIRLAQQLYPNHPDVLGVSGIIAYLENQRDIARKYFEEAEVWKANKPIVNFYFGGLLIASDTVADRTRGKTILKKLVNGEDAELKELAGLAMLTSPTVPMTTEDVEFFYEALKEESVFREDNPNLPIEALRLVTNRVVTAFPEEGLELGELMIRYPQATLNDYIGLIRIAQIQGDRESSREFMDLLIQNADLAPGLEENPTFQRIKVVQHFFDEEIEEGLILMEKLTADPEANVPALQETFQAIQTSTPTIETERRLLNAYLEMDVHNPGVTLGVLTRLVQIQPLALEKWQQYAMEKLFESNPGVVGDWLVNNDAAGLVIEHITADQSAMDAQLATVLVNAYIAENEIDSAQETLTQTWNKLSPAVAYILQTRIHTINGSKESAIETWGEAYQLTTGTNQFPLLKSLGFLALELDQSVSAMQCLYTALSAGISFTREQAISLLQLTLAHGNLRQSIRTADYLVQIEPSEALHKNNLAYFHFLAEEQVEESVEIMRELVENYPEIHQYRLTLALGLVKAGRMNEADRLLQNTQIDWNSTSPRGLLIYVVVLAATDQRTLAQGLMQNLETDGLIPEEKALLQSI